MPGSPTSSATRPLTGAGALEGVEEQAEFALAADQRCEPAVGLDFQAGARLVGADHLPERDGLLLALQGHRAQRPRLEVALDEPMRPLGDGHAPRLADLLEPRRDVGGVAHGRVVHAQIAADGADYHQPGVDSLAGPEGDPARRELALVALERARDAQRRVHGPARVVLVGDGRAEQRHDPVAQELVHRALVAVHLGQHELEGPAHELVHLLGVEARRTAR
jgi:hypothetical protein